MELPENLDALTVQQKLDLVLRILAGRSDRLDRFEAGLAALGRQVASQASVKLDRCAKHVDVPGGNCVGCFVTANAELQKSVDFLLAGIRQADELLYRASAHSAHPAHDMAQVRFILSGLLSPKTAGDACKQCGAKIAHILPQADAPVPGPGLAGIEGIVFDPKAIDGVLGLVCLECHKKMGVQAPAQS